MPKFKKRLTQFFYQRNETRDILNAQMPCHLNMQFGRRTVAAAQGKDKLQATWRSSGTRLEPMRDSPTQIAIPARFRSGSFGTCGIKTMKDSGGAVRRKAS